MKRILVTAISVLLLAGMVVSGTVAYLTDRDGAVNTMTTGNVEIRQYEQDRYGNDFQQNQTILPITGSAQTDKETGEDRKGYPREGMNYVDKLVTVENVGNTPAYVRTLIAIPKYTYQDQDTSNAGQNVLHYNTYWSGTAYEYMEDNSDIHKEGMKVDGTTYRLDSQRIPGPYTSADRLVANMWSNDGKNIVNDVTINGKKYEVYITTHETALEVGERTAPNLSGFYLDKNVDYDHDKGVYTYNGKEISGLTGQADILVLSQAVQAGGFDSAADAFKAAFDNNAALPTADQLQQWFEKLPAVVVEETEEGNNSFKTAVTANEETVVVSLSSNVTYEITSGTQGALAMGGDNTETIIINGNGHTINFKQLDSDWSKLNTANNAKLIIRNAHITNSGYNNGPWNQHDINFGCNVELVNVTSDKAIALRNGGTLKNVTIKDDREEDDYGLWIVANGQSVTLDNVTFDMKKTGTNVTGRGIKIGDQYVDHPQKVTLKVSNSTFKTDKKAAVLVTSTAGADISWTGNDISAVVADQTNAVWVDNGDGYKNLADVTVTGGTAIVES